MKKLLNTLRSMRFGILLLALIALFSVAGSVIPQGREPAWYVQSYPNLHGALLALQLHRVFQSWYFVLLLALLCLNLSLCSLVRIVSVVRGRDNFLSSAAELKNGDSLTEAGLERLRQHLERSGCRRADCGTAAIYYKRLYGRYGSFITHLAILLTVLFGAAALYLPRTVDRDCFPGESIALNADLSEQTEASGSSGLVRFAVASFRTADETGQLDYASELTITLPDGSSRSGEISVNHPLSFGPYKVYQQSYGTAGSVTVTNTANGGSDTFAMTDPSFLSLDGADGLLVVALYPDYLLNSEGEIMPIPGSASSEYSRPVYYTQIIEDGASTLRFFFPGDTVDVGSLSFLFGDPLPYPGLRIKHTPVLVNALLVVSFVLMIVGLAMLFFLPPVLVKLDGEGYAVGGPKPEGTRLELRAMLKDYRKEDPV